MSGTQNKSQEWSPGANPWLIAVVVTLAAFMEVLDTTIVNVSLPHIAGNLSTSYDDASWALTSYLAANGIVLTISGWLSRLFGRKRYFLICIGMFTVCSFLCGISSNLGELIVFRLLQGFFGGGLQPTQQSIILDTFPPEKRGAAFGLTAIATVVAPVLGPTLGGYITDNASWRWVFFINIPVGLFALMAVAALVQDPPWAQQKKSPVDYIGLGLIALGLGCLEVMMDRGEDDDWFGSPFICLMGLFTVIGILGAIGWLLVAKRPAVELRVLNDRNFAVGSMAISVVGVVLYASAVVIPQFSQQVIGYTATLAGLVLSPGGLGIIVLIPFVGRLMKVVQTRYIIAFGFFVMGSSLVYSAHLVLNIDFTHLVMYRLSQTVSLGFLFVPISTIAYQTIPRELRGDASALFSMFRNVFGAVGISLAQSQVTERTQVREAHIVHWMTPFHQPFNEYLSRSEAVLQRLGRPATELQAQAQQHLHQQFIMQASTLAYNDVFMIFSVVAFAMVPFCFLLRPARGGGGGGGGH
ncbi:DHA2 family efflux MFS transporter permease subunit [Rhizosaccharibacter radicis]|uniref:DHA2 family efflux MFS transporter permease subunit n=1 Tax=Rhizosaccharibacter radicis TaxID=2782605 RepID=A0ABT1VXG4_9PROT|nr:DHA2 family efflux MFS transporter permease subunit [Acetobacteraceae bacterium KSS12]